MNLDQPYIAYVGNFLFPWGQAASRRVYGNALSLMHGGFDVRVASGGPPADSGQLEVKTPETGRHLLTTGLDVIPDQSRGEFTKAITLVRSSLRRIPKWLSSHTELPQAVILYGYHSPILFTVQRWCRKNRVPLILDVTEWNEARNQANGRFSLVNLNYKFSRKFLVPKVDGAISISRYLEDYFSSQGTPTIRIPPTVDLESWRRATRPSKNSNELNILYAGTPAGSNKLLTRVDSSKDILVNMVKALTAQTYARRIKLRIFGPSVSMLQGLDLTSINLEGRIEFVGRIPQDEVPAELSKADFTFLFREQTLNSTAGFPTKVVESLAAGTPVICNYSGDLKDYLRDGKEAIVAEDTSVEACVKALSRATALTDAELAAMRGHARSCAEAAFSYTAHSKRLCEFAKSLA